jgi:hypothetical protein
MVESEQKKVELHRISICTDYFTGLTKHEATLVQYGVSTTIDDLYATRESCGMIQEKITCRTIEYSSWEGCTINSPKSALAALVTANACCCCRFLTVSGMSWWYGEYIGSEFGG